jgi:hypothetical protein
MQQAFKLPAVCPVCPNSALKPWIKGYAYKRSKQCDLSLKTSLEAGSSSQAAGKALTWRNHTGLTCSGSWTKVGWLSSSAATDIVKNYNNKSSITKIGDSEVCPPQWILKPLCGFIYVGYALQLSHVRGQPINEVGVGRGGCWKWVRPRRSPENHSFRDFDPDIEKSTPRMSRDSHFRQSNCTRSHFRLCTARERDDVAIYKFWDVSGGLF